MGRAYVLFPIPDASLQNPLPPGRHSLPGTAWEVDSAGGRESILIVASRQPLLDLENELGSVKRASVDGPAEVSATVVATLRGIGSVARKEPPPTDAGNAPGVAEAVKRLSRQAASGSVWIREIVLENPRD